MLLAPLHNGLFTCKIYATSLRVRGPSTYKKRNQKGIRARNETVYSQKGSITGIESCIDLSPNSLYCFSNVPVCCGNRSFSNQVSLFRTGSGLAMAIRTGKSSTARELTLLVSAQGAPA
ncbi:Hypothetical protein Deide_1p01252 (plasmid) [Deinococcus deserti VCD115]|uniref:Uncharacterized protein n=1 Tax=Deinococcus deserti (strain DSM 17065 / CIP 109153 / LMG 22923 / VCD115) TaxID=546414 RepID=C1D2C2_DEIDV|nr:Hypothetical protein Deide_1p01252 [Deinococcus deserti VCD115]